MNTTDTSMEKRRNGRVILVGAGPGAFDLITLRGVRRLKAADVVVYDNLISEELLKLARPEAELIYAGKRGGGLNSLSQPQINELLVGRAREGKLVVRLKGGDPLIFGRGGEEAQALRAAGIEYEIVPGVSSATAGPAFAGIPLTHRELGSFVTFATGHQDPAKNAAAAVPWRELAHATQGRGTLVLLMATGRMRETLDELRAGGLAPETPAVAVQSATLASQRVVRATVGTLAEAAARTGLRAPATIVIGDCAGLGEKLDWAGRMPLFGRRLLITRAPERSDQLADELRDLGAEVVSFPTIAIAEPATYAPLDAALAHLGEFDWVAFTSATAVDVIKARLFAQGRDARAFHGIRIAAIGPATAERLRSLGLVADVVPTEFRGEAIAEALGEAQIKGARFLLPRAAEANPALPRLLRQLGAAQVTEVAAYRTVRPESRQTAAVIEMLAAGEIDLVVFTSPSTARNFLEMVGNRVSVRSLRAAAIGPVTAGACRELGLDVVVQARQYTVQGLIDAIRQHFAENRAM